MADEFKLSYRSAIKCTVHVRSLRICFAWKTYAQCEYAKGLQIYLFILMLCLGVLFILALCLGVYIYLCVRSNHDIIDNGRDLGQSTEQSITHSTVCDITIGCKGVPASLCTQRRRERERERERERDQSESESELVVGLLSDVLPDSNCCCWFGPPVNAQNRHADFIGIYGGFVTSGAEYIGAVVVSGVSKFTLSASAETLAIYGVSFACSTETLGICDVFATCTAHNLMTSMVYCVVRTEHPCPQPNDVHGLLRCENRASMSAT